MKILMNFLKNNFILAVFTLLVATASCSFTNDTVDPGDKEKEQLLVNLISHVLKRNHFSPADLTDEFSKDIFDNYVKDLDPGKRYFLESDYKEFQAYEYLIDDQIRDSKVDLFNLTYERLLQRQEESQKIFTELIKKPFDFSIDESINTDYDKIPYSKNKKELKDHWRKLLKLSALGTYYDKVEEQKENPEEEQKSLVELEKETRAEIKKSMLENFDLTDDVERLDYFSVFVNTITTHFDPHTNFFPPQTKDRFDTSMSGKLEGIGARLQKKMDYISVLEIISGGPAWKSELIEVGDKILKVAQENDTMATSIVGMRIGDAVELIKGPKGSKVILTLKKVDGSIEDITLTRDIVQIEETFAKSVIGKDDAFRFGFINLPKFYFDMEDPSGRAAGNDVSQEIKRLKTEGMDGLIIDLRNNGGGSLREVIEMAGLFVDKGPVVQVALKDKRTRTLRDSDSGEILWEGPLVIMVNEFSASASEILAAALQDYDRAVIIGSKQTFGKGTVQNFEDLNQWVRNNEYGDLGAIKLTTQKFYRINGGSTQLEGVKSDVVTPGRYSYILVGERDEQYPLPYDEIPKAEYDKFTGYANLSESIKKAQKRVDANPNFKLLDENAKWLSNQREDNNITLNFTAYKERLDRLEKETEKFESLSDYKNTLDFDMLAYEKALVKTDSALGDKREAWIKNLKKDVYVEEAVNVLKDLRMNNIKNDNKTKWSVKD
ncbi:carboxy terminal-processing peptidase [Nonlabens sp. MB-3u-79]|uniref:carboxy terminal-processing peptidase n=2 Tax=Nonlabens TaxID=363408 RepID=UPI001E51E032|nr:carboxy terminal-processing peptidase [Nonlabens sp. MB-3u-79]|tara:strand:- start:15058 stop:17214 length:2157 start_codon:yes stop_codon:yes gene_type:complete